MLACFGLGDGNSSFDMDGVMRKGGFIDSSTWIDGLIWDSFKFLVIRVYFDVGVMKVDA